METAPKTARLVLVENHRGVADSIGYALEAELPVKVVAWFQSLAEARQKLVELKPDIIITDWRLAEGVGAEMIQSLALKSPETKWLLFAAWPQSFELHSAVAAGVAGCVSKGEPIGELFKAVKALLAGQTFFCEKSREALAHATECEALVSCLNATERKILRYIADGLEPNEIAMSVGVAVDTLRKYISGIQQKLKLDSMDQLGTFAAKWGTTLETEGGPIFGS